MGKDNPLLGVTELLARLDWTTKFAPFRVAIISIAGLAALAVAFSQIGLHLPSGWYVIAFTVIMGLAIGYWLYVRWWQPTDTRMLSIGFALDPGEESKELYKGIMSNLQREIEACGLQDIVEVRRLPTDIHFSSNYEAERYLIKKGLRVLMWGDTTSGKAGGESVSVFNVKYSCQHAVRNDDQKAAIKSTLVEGAQRTNWEVRHSDSLLGMKVVASNLAEVSLYVLAISLASTGIVEHVERAVKILENLLSRLQPRKQDPNFPNINDFRRNTSKLLESAYKNLAGYYSVMKRDYAAARGWALKCLELNDNDYDMTLAAARFHWELGNQSAAHTYAKKAHRLKPKAHAPYLNFGFLHFYNEKYVKALACYKKLDERILKETRIVDVVDFLEREYDKTKKEALFFAAGWLSCKFGDRVRGEAMLHEFIQRVEKRGNFGRLALEAQTVVSEVLPPSNK
jgi:tetratricopeptide (TPR) repeat protein